MPGGTPGGRPKKAPPLPPSPAGGALAVDLSSQAAVAATLDRVARAVGNREIPAASANAIARLATLALQALDTKLRDDLDAVEARLRAVDPKLLPRQSR